MKIEEIENVFSVHIIADNGHYRRFGSSNWEKLYGCSWEDVHGSEEKELEKIYQSKKSEVTDVDEFLREKATIKELYEFMEKNFHTIPHQQAFDSLLARLAKLSRQNISMQEKLDSWSDYKTCTRFEQKLFDAEKYNRIVGDNDGYTLAHILFAKDEKIREIDRENKALRCDMKNILDHYKKREEKND